MVAFATINCNDTTVYIYRGVLIIVADTQASKSAAAEIDRPRTGAENNQVQMFERREREREREIGIRERRASHGPLK